MPEGTRRVELGGDQGLRGDGAQTIVAVEAPLEIRVAGRPMAVTLRTPGQDIELALGYLLAEGVVEARFDVAGWCRRTGPFEEPHRGKTDPDDTVVIDVELQEQALDRWARRRVEREFRSNSACGACGKPSLDDLYIRPVRAGDRRTEPSPPFAFEQLEDLVERAAVDQEIFRTTGAVHGAAAFDHRGRCLAVFEDVGRHNALDKLIGWSLLGRRDERPADRSDGLRSEGNVEHELLDGLVVLSTGRAGFEIVQKALRARVSVLVTLGAATDWAVEMAREGGVALIGFGAGEPIRYN